MNKRQRKKRMFQREAATDTALTAIGSHYDALAGKVRRRMTEDEWTIFCHNVASDFLEASASNVQWVSENQ